MGVFVNALGIVVGKTTPVAEASHEPKGLGSWLFGRLRRRPLRPSRLAIVERINLGQRQTLALVEADGQRVLIATSADGGATFFPLKAARFCKPESEKGKRL